MRQKKPTERLRQIRVPRQGENFSILGVFLLCLCGRARLLAPSRPDEGKSPHLGKRGLATSWRPEASQHTTNGRELIGIEYIGFY